VAARIPLDAARDTLCRMTFHRTALSTLCTAALAAAVLAGCSSPAATSAAPATPAAPAAPAKDQAAACLAQVTLDTTIPPGIDPDGPPPAAAELQAWAATVAPQLAIVEANAPDTLAGPIAVYRGLLTQAQAGQPMDLSSQANGEATATLSRWVYDSCGYQKLDATVSGGALSGVPATLKAGPVAIRMTSAGDPAAAVLLTARVKAGQSVTPVDIDSGAVDFEQVTDVVAGTQAMGPEPAYGVAMVQPGSYVVVGVLGTPPAFQGTTSAAITVS
jgi:hypothetical protein